MNKNQYKTLTETLIKEVDELNAVKRSSRRVIKSCDEMNKAYLDRNRFLEEKVEELEADSKDLINERNDFAKQINEKDVMLDKIEKLLSQLQTKKRYSADEISQWCGSEACAVCNHMQIGDGGNGECDLEIYGNGPCCWSTHVIETLDRIMTFESQADTVVEDTEND